MSSGDLIVLAIVIALAAGAIYVLWNNHRKGKSSCGCNCSGCSKAGQCGSAVIPVDGNNTCDCCKKE
ncbi:MAG: FeoB-associated Cys-rich membrane protein [Candidatus Methanomethylophilaceae archaeon]|nr:FeoB-associated Cys-rich membrane protein [Candidatus Methanomethylophilaceae archaeon]MBO7351606.1 FeoB-associated Cys-rich membrane protein [Candidatus Methanomethylophilaceae archaeon]MBP5685545.1 FeoB-associated Cys-rich membrane protein [Candidatus Methanomethylophilaceae archaeon]MBP5734978.1 FeoB-associated Cys-rich membrane protein [Candidatus Methanomethylophilaceae archaeon]